MSRLRYASLALIVAAALLATGSGAFTSADASRASTIGVAGDGEAYLGVTVDETKGTVDGDPFPLLELTDNFPEDVGVDSVSVPDDAPISIGSDEIEIDGDVKVECDAAADGESVTLEIEVSGETVEVTKNEEVTVTCIDPDPEFNGCGSVDTHPAIEVDERIYQENSGGQDSKLIAVRIDGERYDNPNDCNNGQPDDSNPNNGNG